MADAKDVMRLRSETGAPVMDCRSALDEAGGDFEKAKEILRVKGKAAASKRVDRATSAGVAALSISSDSKRLAGVVLECETDFVALNQQFVDLAQEIADAVRNAGPGADPLTATSEGESVQDMIEDAVGRIRENIRVAKAQYCETPGSFATYIHHDRKKAVAVELEGDATNARDVGRQIAIQAVAHPPEFLTKDEVPQEKLDKEMETETKRAIEEGKPADVAKNIATGRINKEYLKRVVLLEQPFYRDGSMSLSQYIDQESKSSGGKVSIKAIYRFAVGEE